VDFKAARTLGGGAKTRVCSPEELCNRARAGHREEMSTQDDEKRADEETLPDTPLHAYREGREEDVEGDVEKLKSSDPDESQRSDVSEGDESSGFPEAPKQ
jgi:hypothetical protein